MMWCVHQEDRFRAQGFIVLFCSVVAVKHAMDAKKFVTSILDYASKESAYKPQGERVFSPPYNWIPAVITKG